MIIELAPDLERLVERKIGTNGYRTADDVVRAALVLIDEIDGPTELRRGDVEEKIAQGLKSLREGKGLDGEEVFEELEAELRLMESRSQP